MKGGCEHVCTNNGTEAVCSCNEGYKVSTEDDKKCTKIHPCDKDTKGGCDQTCNKGEGEDFTCSCTAPDWKLNEEDGKSCDKGILILILPSDFHWIMTENRVPVCSVTVILVYVCLSDSPLRVVFLSQRVILNVLTLFLYRVAMFYRYRD